jgi:hypothetical protein
MSLWELEACLDGWNRAQGSGHHYNGGPISDADYEALCEIGDRWNGRD